MTTDAISFYLQHREQIEQWAGLQGRVDRLMRDAVTKGDTDAALRLLRGESGDQEADFYIRNQALIREWDEFQAPAGQALHKELFERGSERGWDTSILRNGWTTVVFRSPEFDELRSLHDVWVELAWTKQHLLSTRRGYPFPRLAVALRPQAWEGESHSKMKASTHAVARGLGMTDGNKWQIHWGMLDPITESQSLPEYAEQCLDTLQRSAEALYPVLVEAIATAKDHD